MRVWQPGSHKGFQVYAEPGTPSWFELHTRDYDANVQFYRDVFGWDTTTASDEPQFRYTTLGDGDDALAGVMDAGPHPDLLPDGIAAHWAVYFGTDDVEKTLERVVELGGTVVRQAEDTPYGRLAEAAERIVDGEVTAFKARRRQQLAPFASDPANVADQVCAAVKANRFYILTHPASVSTFDVRARRIVAGDNPVEPPELVEDVVVPHRGQRKESAP